MMDINMPDLGEVTIPAKLLTPYMLNALIEGLDTQLLEADEHSTLDVAATTELVERLYYIRGSR